MHVKDLGGHIRVDCSALRLLHFTAGLCHSNGSGLPYRGGAQGLRRIDQGNPRILDDTPHARRRFSEEAHDIRILARRLSVLARYLLLEPVGRPDAATLISTGLLTFTHHVG